MEEEKIMYLRNHVQGACENRNQHMGTSTTNDMSVSQIFRYANSWSENGYRDNEFYA
jgi:hypothetical protein